MARTRDHGLPGRRALLSALLLALPAWFALGTSGSVLAAEIGADRPSQIGPGQLSPTGMDISYPQCGSGLPSRVGFAIIGVNGGRASTENPCLGPELEWAEAAVAGDGPQTGLQLYLNTGDPGSYFEGEPVPDWPSSGATPFGDCLPSFEVGRRTGPGQVSVACAWEYGYQKASLDLLWLGEAASELGISDPAHHPFWLDVELSNTWQTEVALNAADLEGMVQTLRAAGANSIGIYALPTQWQEITGGNSALPNANSLLQLPDWLQGAASLAAAADACDHAPFNAGPVTLTQFPQGYLDGDYPC